MTSPTAIGTGVLIGDHPTGTPEWHATRAGRLGGSEIAAVLGLSKWESRFSLWHRKTGRIAPQDDNDEMAAGRRLEHIICDWWAEQHPDHTTRRVGTYAHRDRPWQAASPDRVATTPGPRPRTRRTPAGIVEAKFALYDDDWGEPGTDQIPPYYLTQTRWYLDVFDLPICWVPVFIGSSAQFREYVVHADPAHQQHLRYAGEQFIGTLTAGPPPDIDAHTATYDAVRRLHPGIEDVDVPIPRRLAEQYEQALRDYKTAKDGKQLATSLVAAEIGNGRRATFDGRRLAVRVAVGDAAPFLRPGRGIPAPLTTPTPAGTGSSHEGAPAA